MPQRYDGLDRYKARELVLKEIEELGFLRGKEEKLIPQPFGDRSGVVIEPLLTEQWYVDAATLAKPAIEAVETGKTVFVPKNWEKTYFEWMRNIQPWCISRQLWWGHQIPAWYGPDGEVFVEENEELALAAAAHHYETRVMLTRDEDVLDTWFSSALWPFSTLGWPEQTPEVRRYYPTDVARHRLRHHLLLGRPHDDVGTALHAQGAVPHRLYPCPGARREGAEDVEVERQRHRPARTHRQIRRGFLALHACRDGGARPRHQARAGARRRLSQFRHQAVERGALCRNERRHPRCRFRSDRLARSPSIAGLPARRRAPAISSPAPSRSTDTTKRPERSTSSSGTSSATGISNSSSRC